MKEILLAHRKVMVALSGGLDSSFLLYAAVEAVGAANSYAAIGVSPSLARAEYETAREFCRQIGLARDHLISVATHELDNTDYCCNDSNRCFFCKQELFARLRELAASLAIETICDGTTADDLDDHRPGRRAAEAAGINSPLLEVDLGKEEIRKLAKSFALSIWDKPQSACLASRIPYYSEITVDKLKQIEEAEDFLKSLGFRQLRVRHHGDLARIELPPSDMGKAVGNSVREKVTTRFRELGFLFVTVDIAGFQSGSMNIMLKGGEDGS